MLCATFLTVPVVALTATASKRDLKAIKESLNLKNPVEVIGNPNRANIFYKKAFRKEDDVDFFEEILKPIALGLKEKTVGYPITILYLPLRWCGLSFNFLKCCLVMTSITHSKALVMRLHVCLKFQRTGFLHSTMPSKQQLWRSWHYRNFHLQNQPLGLYLLQLHWVWVETSHQSETSFM